MSVENVVRKSLPRSDETVRLTVESRGDDGGDVTIKINVPLSTNVSDRTKEEYADHSLGADKFWHEVLNNSTQNYKVEPSTYRTKAGNKGLDHCRIKIDFFEEENIEGVIKRLLKALDKAAMNEQRKQDVLEKSAEAAQETVCDDISTRIEDIELT